MVKKIDSNRGIGSPTSIETTKTSGVGGVGKVGQVGAVGDATGAGRVQGVGRKISPANRELLMRMVDEESEKLFGEGQLPERKKKVIEGAVKMVLEGSTEEDTEE